MLVLSSRLLGVLGSEGALIICGMPMLVRLSGCRAGLSSVFILAACARAGGVAGFGVDARIALLKGGAVGRGCFSA